ncbi:hypothetical protein M378DRAFT_361404 [Amanita muscaria Koide BX008]|uniref:Uncharacterized protein n=1 Tax=Amanita muscaria (strain Koide BX008) TaxID=946122 RepID=A0A0C2S4X0_AMAMK|nr:hypothetical protein M378DRAFT_361404 [Amanita muscaria Koide BX008]
MPYETFNPCSNRLFCCNELLRWRKPTTDAVKLNLNPRYTTQMECRADKGLGRKKAKAKEENRSVPSGRLVLLMGNRAILLDLLLFRRQDHSSSSNTIHTSISTNISTSDSRASRDNQVLFLVLCFRQSQGHRVASSLNGGERERPLLLPIQLCGGRKPAGLIRSAQSRVAFRNLPH